MEFDEVLAVQRYLRNMDWILVLTVAALLAIGMVLIGSATHNDALVEGYNRFVLRQGIFIGINIVVVCLLLRIDYHSLTAITRPCTSSCWDCCWP
jgi:rod shape determining protein RodA